MYNMYVCVYIYIYIYNMNDEGAATPYSDYRDSTSMSPYDSATAMVGYTILYYAILYYNVI